MDLFGIGGSELLLLLFLAGVVLGPRRLARLARDLRNVISQIRGLTTNLTEQLNREINLLEADEAAATKPSRANTAEAPPEMAEALPEAYRRFREDFPTEGRLEDRAASADGARQGPAAKPSALPRSGPLVPTPPPGRPNQP